ncbi:complement C1r subcomponent [Hemicordylus capensis]|uniref:complement C1r subcomponent n=1 Tax=Hemicordylus capensis TaxID=884348 RepID=UPI0023038FEE|nr:complement C1r subcomponent [Hemicordylus capensis]XP_053146764.1 complement C1r subcomponent [Hemicordylus capensis]XP_053146765.1 complement C1r subcomponent [Hemicordylus capensis]
MFPPLLLLLLLQQGAFLFEGVHSNPVSRLPLYGEVRSPNYPKPYPNNNITTWDITVPKGFKVKLTFRHFDLEPSEACLYDYVKIRADKKDLGRYCGHLGSTMGNHPGGREFVSTGNRMKLFFHSDFSNEDNGNLVFYKGFLAYYQAVDLDECTQENDVEDEGPRCQHFCHNYVGGYFCSCQPSYQLQSDRHSCKVECSNELFTEPSGYISSPGYPQPYPPDLQCNYSIRVERGLSINLKFLEPFEIDDHQQVHCPYDQLKIQAERQEIGDFCGTASPGSIETNSSSVDILFLTDESGFSRGWKIRYSSERIRCPQPVPNDEFTIIKDPQSLYRFQDYFIVSCKTGYNLIEGNEKLASFTSVCQYDGTWHRSMPRCEIVNCGEPKPLSNGAFDYISRAKNNNYESAVQYHCNEPYYKLFSNMGRDTYTCSAQGSWKNQDHQDNIPVCLPVCGKPENPVTDIQRIIGGSEAKKGSFPWQAKTVISGNGRAGGALLGDRWILTAAHTVYPKGQAEVSEILSLEQVAEKAEVFLGHTVITELHKLGNRPVRRLFVHPDYNPDAEHNFDGDIALIELRDPVTLGPDVLPICLPDPGNGTFYVRGWMGYASGFGVEKNILADRLKYVQLPVANRAACENWLHGKKINGSDPVFSANMFCAGSPRERKDTCQGDSGGVFAVRDPETGRWVATGIVSWGIGCAQGYGFYTKVIQYLDWIKSIVGEDWVSMIL